MSLVLVYALVAAFSPSPHNITLWMHTKRSPMPFILGALFFDGALIKASEVLSSQNKYFYIVLSLGSLFYLLYIILSTKKKDYSYKDLSFKSGLLIQLINPFPWIFWLSIAPSINLNYQSPIKLIIFLSIIYGFKIVSHKMIKLIKFNELYSKIIFKYAMPLFSIALITKQLFASI